VIVAIGTDDMIPGPGSDGCDAPITAFGIAIESILTRIRAKLPAAHVYVQAILPTPGVPDATRAHWNAVLRRVATTHGVPFVDPSSALSSSTDYAGFYYPNNRGAEKIARFWSDYLPRV
jgi:hypothetical protein